MTRLRHSDGGFLRLAQMSGANVTLITEGRLDRLFFSAIADKAVGARSHITFCVRSAREISSEGGGKLAVLKYYDFLRRKKALSSELDGRRTLFVLCLDKDLDDLTRHMRRSPHILYTDMFDVESYVFRYGDLPLGCSITTATDEATIVNALDPISGWAVRAVRVGVRGLRFASLK